VGEFDKARERICVREGNEMGPLTGPVTRSTLGFDLVSTYVAKKDIAKKDRTNKLSVIEDNVLG
jgi:hypothetical protein